MIGCWELACGCHVSGILAYEYQIIRLDDRPEHSSEPNEVHFPWWLVKGLCSFARRFFL